MGKLDSSKAVCIVLVFCAATAVSSRAQTFTTLVNFNGANGCCPQAGLVQGHDGNLLGTTSGGGANGNGTVFKLTPPGTLITLHSFDNTGDGSGPYGLVLATDGDFYGTTQFGGAKLDGTVFKITASGTLTTLHSFFHGADGDQPVAALVQAADGNLYGATVGGGASTACFLGASCGTVFKITTGGILTTLHSFDNTDGEGPVAGLVQASDGNFYATTPYGGASHACGTYPDGTNKACGTVFKITSGGTVTTLHSFDRTDGAMPLAGLVQATDGNFYGTTSEGGANGYGTIFRSTPGGTLTTLHSFTRTDGFHPQAGLVQATDGNFYGTTAYGGTSGNCASAGCGTVFKITAGGTLTTLHSFDDSDGRWPNAGLVQAADGNIYGTTLYGGASRNCDLGCGTVFSLAVLTPPLGFVSKDLFVAGGGAASSSTVASDGAIQAGYATAVVNSGGAPYGTAVFSFKQNGVTVSEAGVPASPPTTSARIFIDYRAAVPAVPSRTDAGKVDINTGIAVVNRGSGAANVTYLLRDVLGATLSSGHGTIAAGAHFAKFIDQVKDVASDFSLPLDFQKTIQFGSLEISSDQPLSILALRMTTNQRNEVLFTTTPTADLTQALTSTPMYFPQFADGGGYTTALVLLNTSNGIETGTFRIMDDLGTPLVVNQAGGTADSSFKYSIPSSGAFRFQTDGFPATTKVGWVQLVPDEGTSTPVGAGVFGFNPGNFLVTESGIPAAASTTHARVYVDLSGGHDTGLAIANLAETSANISIMAFQRDGTTGVGTSRGPLLLAVKGHSAKFAGEFVAGLPAEFTGVLDIMSTTRFAALTMRSLTNERGDFLLTTFPIADINRAAPSPIVFPQIADGGGYVTQFILISPGGASSTQLNFYGETGAPLAVGK